MTITRIIGILLIVAGTAGLIYGDFSFTKETHEAELGPLELQVEEKETVAVPTWAGAGAIGLGVVLLLLGGRKR
jgi:multidrug transporter EmrE-like cation transporter